MIKIETNIFSNKELHCIARVLQAYYFPADENAKLSGTGFGCCWYCKYTNECHEDLKNGNGLFHQKVRDKIQNLTGVRLFEPFQKKREEICLIESFQKLCVDDYISTYKQFKEKFGKDAFNKRLKILENECPIEYEYLKELLEDDSN